MKKKIDELWVKNDISIAVEKRVSFTNLKLQQAKVSLKLDRKDFKVQFSNTAGETFAIIYDAANNIIMKDRTQSGITDFHYEFGNKLHYMPLPKEDSTSIDLTIYFDKSSCELFVNDGKGVMTSQLFSEAEYSKMEVVNLSSTELMIDQLSYDLIQGIWE